MTFKARDWLWIIGMAIVCSCGLDKRGWSNPQFAIPAGIVGGGLGFLISRLTARPRRGGLPQQSQASAGQMQKEDR